MMFLSLDYVVSHRAPPRVSVELPRDHLVKKPGELVAALVPGQMLDLSLQLRWISMMLCLLFVVQRQAAPIGLAHLSSNYQQRDVDLASLIHI